MPPRAITVTLRVLFSLASGISLPAGIICACQNYVKSIHGEKFPMPAANPVLSRILRLDGTAWKLAGDTHQVRRGARLAWRQDEGTGSGLVLRVRDRDTSVHYSQSGIETEVGDVFQGHWSFHLSIVFCQQGEAAQKWHQTHDSQ